MQIGCRLLFVNDVSLPIAIDDVLLPMSTDRNAIFYDLIDAAEVPAALALEHEGAFICNNSTGLSCSEPVLPRSLST